MSQPTIEVRKAEEGESRLGKIVAELEKEGIMFQVSDESDYYLITISGH
jgi:hypothetical protein